MKRKNKLILFYAVVTILFMGTPVSLYMVKTTSEKIKTEQNADSDIKKQENKTIAAHVPIEVPTISLVKGRTAMSKIIKGRERRAFTIGLRM